MTAKAEFDITANDQGAKAAWDRQQNAINAVIARIGKMEEAQNKAKQSQDTWFSRGVTGIASAVAGYGSLQSAISLVNAEHERMIQYQNKALTAQQTLAQAQRGAVLNLGVDPNWNASKLVETITNMSKRTGVDETTLTRVASDALSARGDSTIESTMTAIETASRILPDDADGLRTLTAATMDLQKLLGGSAESNIGYMQSVGATSRVTSLKFMAENATPAIAGLTKFGGTKEEAGALFSMFSGSMVDTTGAQSKSSSLNLAKQLEKAVPQGKTTDERIRILQDNQLLAQKFLKDSSFEVAALPAVRGLLSGDANTAERRAYTSAKGAIVGGADAEALYRTTMGQIDALPTIQNARKAQAAGAAGDRLLTGDIAGGDSAARRQTVSEMVEKSGGGVFESYATGLGYTLRTMMNQSPDKAAAEQLEWLANRRDATSTSFEGGVAVQRSVETETSRAIREAAADLRAAASEVTVWVKKPLTVTMPAVPKVPASAKAGTGGR